MAASVRCARHAFARVLVQSSACHSSQSQLQWIACQRMIHCGCRMLTSEDSVPELIKAEQRQPKPVTKAQKISRAMLAYMERARAHDTMMKEQTVEYEIGKRHLANIMGEDPDSFSQEDIDKAIEYLLPSGLFAPKARPMMKHPSEVFPKRKAAQFGLDGRPFHSFFYTGLPNYYEILHEAAVRHDTLNLEEERLREKGHLQEELAKKLTLFGSDWIDLESLKSLTLESLTENDHRRFVTMLDRLASHPLGHQEEEFIIKFRRKLATQGLLEAPKQLMVDETGRGFMTADGKRKSAVAEVTVWGRGSGEFTINGRSILDHFPRTIDREQVMFPLQLSGLLGEVDVVALVRGEGGPTGESGAIRLATSRALLSFISKEVQEKMRIAGLLQQDFRRRERKKPGQEGARKKYTWKRR